MVILSIRRNGMKTLKLKATKKIYCEICGEKLKRTKSFSVNVDDTNIEEAKESLKQKASSWKLTEKQKHCSVCWSIIRETK